MNETNMYKKHKCKFNWNKLININEIGRGTILRMCLQYNALD